MYLRLGTSALAVTYSCILLSNRNASKDRVPHEYFYCCIYKQGFVRSELFRGPGSSSSIKLLHSFSDYSIARCLRDCRRRQLVSFDASAHFEARQRTSYLTRASVLVVCCLAVTSLFTISKLFKEKIHAGKRLVNHATVTVKETFSIHQLWLNRSAGRNLSSHPNTKHAQCYARS